MTESPAEAWVRCRPYIEAALAHQGGGYTIDDVAEAIAAGRAHFWQGERCAVVTEFWDQPRSRTCNMWLLGGDIRELLAMRPVIEVWASAQGCKHIAGGGPRKGWERLLRPFGYRPAWIIYRKDLAA